MFQVVPPKELIAESKMVFLGRVDSVQPSGISTSLSYIPWEGVTFKWIFSEVKVLEPFKGAKKGAAVRIAMLSADIQLADSPFMLCPEKGDIFLFCVLPTPVTNVFAALTAPYNESLSIIPLHRVPSSTDDAEDLLTRSSEETKELEKNLAWHYGRTDLITKLLRDDRQFSPIFALVTEKGALLSAGIKQFHNAFASELAAKSSTNVVFLEWHTAVSIGGWRSDVPKGYETVPTPKTFSK
jgi:hypothetical protein